MENTNTDVRITKEDTRSRVIKITKERLLSNERTNLVASHLGAPLAIQAAHFLEELGYLRVTNILTETIITDHKLTGLTVSVERSSNFKELYDAHEKDLAQRKEAEKADKKE